MVERSGDPDKHTITMTNIIHIECRATTDLTEGGRSQIELREGVRSYYTTDQALDGL
jgi:hypothetical protein